MKTHIICIVTLLLISTVAFAQGREQGSERDYDSGKETIRDNYGVRQGTIDRDRTIRDNYGNRMGRIDTDGTVRDNYGNRVGTVRKEK